MENMENEIIFSYYTTWHDRYEDKGEKTVIAANFDDPAVWPYTVKKYATDEENFSDPEPPYEIGSARLSPALYAKLKAIITWYHVELEVVPPHLERDVRDGSVDEFYFATDYFEYTVGGMSVLGFGSEEEEWPEEKRDGYYTVFCIYRELDEALRAEGIELL